MKRAMASWLALGSLLACTLEGADNPALRCTASKSCPDTLTCYRGYCVDERAGDEGRATRGTTEDAGPTSHTAVADAARSTVAAGEERGVPREPDAAASAASATMEEEASEPSGAASDATASGPRAEADDASARSSGASTDSGAIGSHANDAGVQSATEESEMPPPPPGPSLFPIPLPPVFPPPPPAD